MHLEGSKQNHDHCFSTQPRVGTYGFGFCEHFRADLFCGTKAWKHLMTEAGYGRIFAAVLGTVFALCLAFNALSLSIP